MTPGTDTSTIAAVSTAPGIGGIGIVRLSGPSAKEIVETLAQKTLKKPRYAYHAFLKDPISGRDLDDALVMYFPAPHSYTGEPMAECHVHGNPIVVSSVLSACFQLGAVPAPPGAFTARAFLNGKLDLTQAEAVADLIHAQSEQGQTAALSHLKGRLFQHLSQHRSRLRHLLEHIEGALDFPDEIPAPDRAEVIHALHTIRDDIETWIHTQDYGKRVRDGITCVIVGKPNAGKSSLLNQLLGEKRAIISPIPGTTRDFIEADIQLGGFRFHLIDTAGVRDTTTDPIELLGIRNVRKVIKEADVILWVVDGTMKCTEQDCALLHSFPKKVPVYLICNKADKKQRFTLLSQKKIRHTLPLSAKSGAGIQTLQHTLLSDFTHVIAQNQTGVVCNARQVACLQQSLMSLKQVLKTMAAGFEFDAISYELKTAILHLGEVSGDAVTEEILDGIFSRFCVGK